jgi:hypothetical protein
MYIADGPVWDQVQASEPPTVFRGERCRSRCITVVVPSRRCVSATRAGSSGRSPADGQFMFAAPGPRREPFRRPPLKPAAAKPMPAVAAKCLAEIGAWCARHGTRAVGRMLLLQPTPHMPPSAAASALFPPRPRAAQPNLNASDTTPIPTDRRRLRDRVRVRSEYVDV